MVLRLDKLTAGYGSIVVVRELDLTVDRGEVVALLGPNGAGKTTALLTIAGVLPALSGTIELMGHETTGSAPFRIAREGVALVPEDRGLFHQLTVAENLRLRRRGRRDAISDEQVFELFPALEGLRRRRVGLLSGGEQQMLAVSSALATRPRLLLIDEMSMGLAPILVGGLLERVRRIADESGMAVLLVEQQIHAALAIADRAVVLSRGEVMLTGTSQELADQPKVIEASYMGERALR
jgi:branched-chain amino acid transport system ATP-binding protein